MIGPLLRTRRNRLVFSFVNVTPEKLMNQRWLAKPPSLNEVTVTAVPGVKDLLVMASLPIAMSQLPSEQELKFQSVVLFRFDFSRTVDPETALTGIPARKGCVPRVTKMKALKENVQVGARWAAVVPALAAPAGARRVAAASSPAASMEIKRFMITVPLCVFLPLVAGLACRA
jgi:hypothetical protein